MYVETSSNTVRCKFSICFGIIICLNYRNVLLEPSQTHDVPLVNLSLGQECEARCYGPEELVSSLLNTTLTSASAFSRSDLQFERCV